MQPILAFLKNVWQDIIQENKNNPFFAWLLLQIVTVPLSLGVNNLVLILTALAFIMYRKTLIFNSYQALIWSVALFVLMCFSVVWSVDIDRTLTAIPKEISLVAFPVLFSFIHLSKIQVQKILKYYSFSMVLYVLFYGFRALIRYFILKDVTVFFYHELVTEEMNAIYFSAFISVAIFYFLQSDLKLVINIVSLLLLFGFLMLLSSKNVIIIVFLLILFYQIKFGKVFVFHKKQLWIIPVLVIILGLFSGKIIDRFKTEWNSNIGGKSETIITNEQLGIHVLTINEAWNNQKFTPNDYFPGGAFRIYQIRLFCEFLSEKSVFWTGYGLNASFKKLEEKAIQYHVFMGNEKEKGYHQKNFHNQYIQNFAELGILGFVVLVIIMVTNLKNGLANKDFSHIAFAVLMISLFLTESFLWRQRGVVFFSFLYCLFNSNYSSYQSK